MLALCCDLATTNGPILWLGCNGAVTSWNNTRPFAALDITNIQAFARILALDTFGGGDEGHGIAVVAIEGDTPVVTAPLDGAGMTLRQQAVGLHHAVDTLAVERLPALRQAKSSLVMGWLIMILWS